MATRSNTLFAVAVATTLSAVLASSAFAAGRGGGANRIGNTNYPIIAHADKKTPSQEKPSGETSEPLGPTTKDDRGTKGLQSSTFDPVAVRF